MFGCVVAVVMVVGIFNLSVSEVEKTRSDGVHVVEEHLAEGFMDMKNRRATPIRPCRTPVGAVVKTRFYDSAGSFQLELGYSWPEEFPALGPGDSVRLKQAAARVSARTSVDLASGRVEVRLGMAWSRELRVQVPSPGNDKCATLVTRGPLERPLDLDKVADGDDLWE